MNTTKIPGKAQVTTKTRLCRTAAEFLKSFKSQKILLALKLVFKLTVKQVTGFKNKLHIYETKELLYKFKYYQSNRVCKD